MNFKKFDFKNITKLKSFFKKNEERHIIFKEYVNEEIEQLQVFLCQCQFQSNKYIGKEYSLTKSYSLCKKYQINIRFIFILQKIDNCFIFDFKKAFRINNDKNKLP